MGAVKIAAKALAEAFGFIKPFVSPSSPLPAMRRVAYLKDRTMLVGQDGVIGAGCESPVKFGAASTTFDGLRVHGLVSILGDAELDVALTDSHVVLTGSGTRASFALAGFEDYPVPTLPSDRALKPAPPGLIPAIKFAAYCADQKGLAGVLSGIYISNSGVMATDGARAIRVLLGAEPPEPMILPARLVSTLCTMEGFTPEAWGVVNGRLWLRHGTRLVWSSLLEPPFPDIDSVFARARGLAKGAPALAYTPESARSLLEQIIAVGGATVKGSLADSKLTAESAGDVSSIKAVIAAEKSRGTGQFVADVLKLQEAVLRFPSAILCGSGVLYFISKENGAEHVLMEIVE